MSGMNVGYGGLGGEGGLFLLIQYITDWTCGFALNGEMKQLKKDKNWAVRKPLINYVLK